MHFHKLELQLSNAPGFRLGNLLPFADFCLTILCAQLCLMMMWLRNEIELSLQSCALFADLIFQKCSGPLSFQIYVITYLMMMWLTYELGSRYSLGHLLPTSSSKSAPNVTVFYDFYMKSSSRYSDVHLLSTTLPDRAPQLRKLRPFRDHGSHLIYPKKCRASRPRNVFKPEFMRSRSLTLLN